LDLPYLIDEEAHITDMIPMLEYVVKKYGNSDMLGRSLEDKGHVDMFLWSVDNIMRELMRLGCTKGSSS
jgi:hypothetical protein